MYKYIIILVVNIKHFIKKKTFSKYELYFRFIYCGNIELKNLQGPEVLKLLIAVDELNFCPLISHIQEFLIEHQTEFLRQNPTGILEIVYQHEAFTDLWNFCLEKVCEEPNILFNSDKFINLKAPLLELLLKRDDLKIERELYKFIPLIRFYDIEPTDFFYKVYCYKEILPQDLIHDLLEFHIVPNMKPKANLAPSRKPKLDSTLIESSHIPVFASWIDKKNSSHYNKKNIPYNFKLLYRQSRDGITTDSFHRNCDNKGATICVAKIKDSTQLIGGYNPLDWSGNGWKSTADSFLFNLTNGKNISTAELGYRDNNNTATDVYCRSDHGPIIGNLHCVNNDWTYS